MDIVFSRYWSVSLFLRAAQYSMVLLAISLLITLWLSVLLNHYRICEVNIYQCYLCVLEACSNVFIEWVDIGRIAWLRIFSILIVEGSAKVLIKKYVLNYNLSSSI